MAVVVQGKRWETVRLGEIAEVFSGFAFKSNDLGKEGVPVIKIANIQNKKVLKDCEDHLPENLISPKLEKYWLQKDDFLIAMTGAGSLGKVGKMRKMERRYLVNQRVAIVRTNSEIAAPEFVYQVVSQETYERLLYGWGLGAGQPNVSSGQIGSLIIPFPQIEIQKRIASILSAYDDLIENNLRRIKILEEMAQNLYREWLVKFRFPGHQKVKMLDSPMGKIPEGWEVSALGSLCTLIKEPYREALHASFPLIDLARIPQKTLLASEVGSPKELSTSRIIFSTDDVLFGAIRPYLHKVLLAPTNGVTNVSVFVLRSREEILKPFLAILLSMEDAVRWADQYSTGTKMPVIKWDVFQQMKVLIPKKEVIRGFYDGVWPMMQSVKNTFTRNSNLRQTRDLLLPKLISGELDVSELDITIPEANA